MLNQIKKLDEDPIEPGDSGFQDYQQAKSEFYREIRGLESQDLLVPDRIMNHRVARDHEEARSIPRENWRRKKLKRADFIPPPGMRRREFLQALPITTELTVKFETEEMVE